MFDILWGAEVEVTGATRKACAEAIAEYFGTRAEYYGGAYCEYRVKDSQNRTWKIMRDSSIRPEVKHVTQNFRNHPDDYRVEIVTPICVYDDIPTWQEVIRRARSVGAFGNSSTGVHYHCNAANFTAQTLKNLVNIFNSKEDLIYKALQVNPERERRFCQKVDQEFLEKLNTKKVQTIAEVKRMWYNGHDGSM
jgi:hypothetical protein